MLRLRLTGVAPAWVVRLLCLVLIILVNYLKCREYGHELAADSFYGALNRIPCLLSSSSHRPFIDANAVKQRASFRLRNAKRTGPGYAFADVASSLLSSQTAGSTLVDVLAVAVGWLVIAGSCVRSLPQIIRIVRNKSVSGLSITSFVSEMAAYTINVAYNIRFGYAFSTWGDTLMTSLQHFGIIALIFHYNSDVPAHVRVGILTIFLLYGWALFCGIFGDATMCMLQGFSAFLLAFGGRLPQILLNIRRGSSGELSTTSTALSVAGNAARIFTTVTLVGDKIILATALSQLMLNSTLLFQCIQSARKGRSATVPTPTSG